MRRCLVTDIYSKIMHYNLWKSDCTFFCCHSPQLASVLREVKYLGMLKTQNIPQAALHLYSKRERLHMVGH